MANLVPLVFWLDWFKQYMLYGNINCIFWINIPLILRERFQYISAKRKLKKNFFFKYDGNKIFKIFCIYPNILIYVARKIMVVSSEAPKPKWFLRWVGDKMFVLWTTCLRVAFIFNTKIFNKLEFLIKGACHKHPLYSFIMGNGKLRVDFCYEKSFDKPKQLLEIGLKFLVLSTEKRKEHFQHVLPVIIWSLEMFALNPYIKIYESLLNQKYSMFDFNRFERFYVTFLVQQQQKNFKLY